MLAPWKKSYNKPRQHIRNQRHHFADKCPSSQSYGFSSSHVWMWELDYKESWAPKTWRFWTVVLEKTLESPLDCKEIKAVNPKKNQSWIHWKDWCWNSSTWPPDVKNWLIGKDPDAGKHWRKDKRMTDGLDGITDLMDMNFCMLRELVMDREAWHAAVHGVTNWQTWLTDWTDILDIIPCQSHHLQIFSSIYCLFICCWFLFLCQSF